MRLSEYSPEDREAMLPKAEERPTYMAMEDAARALDEIPQAPDWLKRTANEMRGWILRARGF